MVVAVVSRYDGNGGKERCKLYLVDALMCCERNSSKVSDETIKPRGLIPHKAAFRFFLHLSVLYTED